MHNEHVRHVINCVTVLAALCILVGGFLLWKGYSGGDVLVNGATTAIGGLLGVLSINRLNQHPPKDQPNDAQPAQP